VAPPAAPCFYASPPESLFDREQLDNDEFCLFTSHLLRSHWDTGFPEDCASPIRPRAPTFDDPQFAPQDIPRARTFVGILRLIYMITDAWDMAAVVRSEPCRPQGQGALARSNTRLSSLAQLHRGVPVVASCLSAPVDVVLG